MLEKFSNSRDFLIIFFLFTILYGFAHYVGLNFVIDDTQFSFITQILVAVLTVIATILTILYAISDFIKENPFIKELRKKGIYSQIFTRFIDSLKGVFFSILIIFLLYSFFGKFDKNFASVFEIIASNFILVLFWFSVLRTYRCFKILSILHGLVNFNATSKVDKNF